VTPWGENALKYYNIWGTIFHYWPMTFALHRFITTNLRV